jgi:hypothetical protein
MSSIKISGDVTQRPISPAHATINRDGTMTYVLPDGSSFRSPVRRKGPSPRLRSCRVVFLEQVDDPGDPGSRITTIHRRQWEP